MEHPSAITCWGMFLDPMHTGESTQNMDCLIAQQKLELGDSHLIPNIHLSKAVLHAHSFRIEL